MKWVCTKLVTSVREGMLSDFQFLVIKSLVARRTCVITVLWCMGKSSIVRLRMAKCGVIVTELWSMSWSMDSTFFQSWVTFGQDQRMWRRVPVWPQFLQQSCEACLWNLASLDRVRYHLISVF